MKQKLILLDIDNTLYDSSTFRKKLFQNVVIVLEKNGIKNADTLCEEIHTDLMKGKGLFYPEDFVDELLSRIQRAVSKEELLEIMYDENHVSSYLYQETDVLVKKFEKLGELGIFSQGMERFQMLKIKHIAHMFAQKHVHIVVSKIANLDEIFEKYQSYKVFLLDDALPVLHALKKAYPYVFTIWVKRGKYANSQSPIPGFNPDTTVENLKQSEKIIKEN